MIDGVVSHELCKEMPFEYRKPRGKVGNFTHV